jgi:hypothetical protein
MQCSRIRAAGYVSPLNPAFQFNAEDAVAEARTHIGEQYGFRGIALQLCEVRQLSRIADTLERIEKLAKDKS